MSGVSLVLSNKVGNAICHIYDDALPITAEEKSINNRAVQEACADIHWASEMRRIAKSKEVS